MSPRKHTLWVLIKAPQRVAFNEYPKGVFLWRNKEISALFCCKMCLIGSYGVRIFDCVGFNNTSNLWFILCHLQEREKRDRRDSKGDEKEGQGRKRNRNDREETE